MNSETEAILRTLREISGQLINGDVGDGDISVLFLASVIDLIENISIKHKEDADLIDQLRIEVRTLRIDNARLRDEAATRP